MKQCSNVVNSHQWLRLKRKIFNFLRKTIYNFAHRKKKIFQATKTEATWLQPAANVCDASCIVSRFLLCECEPAY